jgi:SAM-dependent methyltransferase
MTSVFTDESVTEPRQPACRSCGGELSQLFASRLSHSVTSACVPARLPAVVHRCAACGLVQKVGAELVADYSAAYVLFDNDTSADKIVRRAGQPDRTRSEVVARLVAERLNRPGARVLEIGCHRGAFLAALKALAPDWELHGFDLSPDLTPWVERICGPGRYQHTDLSRVSGPFDACVLIHTLEHVPAPPDTLATIRGLLRPGGLACVVVPDAVANPADFYTIDHTTHYDAPLLAATLGRAGFAAEVVPDFIPNELTAVAVPGAARAADTPPDYASAVAELVRFERGLAALPNGPCHVFGTANIGALVAAQLGERCVGFLDEAPFRIGKTVLGRPVRHPRDAAGQVVVLGLAESVAARVAPRLAALGCRVVNPWVNEGGCDERKVA